MNVRSCERGGGDEHHGLLPPPRTSLTGVEGHENDGRADRLVDDGLRQDRLYRGPDEAAVEPLVPEGERLPATLIQINWGRRVITSRRGMTGRPWSRGPRSGRRR